MCSSFKKKIHEQNVSSIITGLHRTS